MARQRILNHIEKAAAAAFDAPLAAAAAALREADHAARAAATSREDMIERLDALAPLQVVVTNIEAERLAAADAAMAAWTTAAVAAKATACADIAAKASAAVGAEVAVSFEPTATYDAAIGRYVVMFVSLAGRDASRPNGGNGGGTVIENRMHGQPVKVSAVVAKAVADYAAMIEAMAASTAAWNARGYTGKNRGGQGSMSSIYDADRVEKWNN